MRRREIPRTTNQVIRTAGISEHIAPFAFQYYAKDFYEAYKKHKSDTKFSPARLFLIARSIELAGKGLHLAQGKTTKDLFCMNHDLESACDQSVLIAYGITLTDVERVELKKANQYYEGKGFEYFLFDFPGVSIDRSGPQQALSGWPNLPDENVLEGIVGKLLTPRV